MNDTLPGDMEGHQSMMRGQQWLEKLLELGKFPADVRAETQATPKADLADREESESYWLTIDETRLTSSQIEVLIGPEGATLDAIQYLANSILNLAQERDVQGSYTIELNGYRSRRQAELLAVAEQVAQQVRDTGQEVEIKALSSAERRQVHSFFQDSEDIETYSHGQEPDRRLVVRLRS